MDRTELLRKIKEEVVNLKTSPLYAERIRNKVFPVIGEGNHSAKIMLVGEAPGKNEAATGRPFCGVAGGILDELLASAEIKREEVYITNIVKDRPPFNRDPLPEEIAVYGPFLDRQIEIIQPKIIATLGRFSMAYIMQKMGVPVPRLLSVETKFQKDKRDSGPKGQFNFGSGTISQLHGKVFETEAGYGKINIVPLYHPAVAIYNSNTKDELKKDFQILKQFN